MALTLALLGVSPALAQGTDAPHPVIVGGWQTAEVDAGSRHAAAHAMAAIKTIQPKTKLAKIDSVEMQVVAGLNYRLNLTLTDNTRWEVVVWKKLDNNMEITSVKPLGKL